MPTQSHIHLAKTLEVGGEAAPIYKWGSLDRDPQTRTIQSINYTRSGRMKVHSIKDGLGNVRKYLDFNYILVIRPEYGYTMDQRIAQIQAMAGELAYLVDNFHCNTAQDHTPFVQRVLIEKIGSFKPISTGLQRFDLEVNILDARYL